jgi:predicted protein tyrosine phosphatase
MNILFLCSQNRLRSPTAERIFRGREGLDVRSAGLDQDAVIAASADLVAWADLIFVMEKAHVNKLRRRFKTASGGKRVVCLHIPDEFECMDPELIRILEARVAPWLARP